VAKVKPRRADGTDYPIEEMPVSRSLKLGQEVRNEEMLIKRTDGQVLPILVSSAPLRDIQGNITAAIVVFEDITEHKKNEAMLHLSEEKYSQLFSGMPSGVAIYEAVDNGENFVFKDFNAAAESIDKVSREEIVGKRITEVFPGVKDFGLFRVFQRVYQTGVSEYFPSAIYKDNRIQSWRENWVYKLPNKNIVAIYNDVTDRKKVEDALKESEAKLRSIVASSSDQIFMLDENLKYLTVNKTLADLLGRGPKEIIGKSISEFFDSKTFAQFSSNIKTVFGSGDSLFVEEKMVAQGHEFYISSSLNPVLDDSGKVIAVAGIVRDITEQKKIELALRESQRKYQDLT
jgi:PAS domain S-box-containing protein